MKTPIFKYINLFHGTDVSRVRNEVIGKISLISNHKHPLFELIVTPFGSMSAHFFGDYLGAIAWNSFTSALGITLLFHLFLLINFNLNKALLFTLLSLGSATSLYFGPVPEKFSMTLVSLIFLFITLQNSLKGKDSIFQWLLAGLLSFGMATTNLITSGICFFTYLFPRIRWKSFTHTFGLCSSIFAITFTINQIGKELGYFKYYAFNSFLQRLLNNELIWTTRIGFTSLLENFRAAFLVNFWSPSTVKFIGANGMVYQSIFGAWDFSLVAILSFILFSIVLIRSKKNLRLLNPRNNPLLQAVYLTFTYFFIFHNFYCRDIVTSSHQHRIETFMWSPYYSLLVLITLYIYVDFNQKWNIRFFIPVILLSFLNNVMVLRESIQFYTK